MNLNNYLRLLIINDYNSYILFNYINYTNKYNI